MTVLRTRLFAASLLAFVAVVACSKSSTGPTTPGVGDFHFTVGAMSSGTLSPSSFTVTLAASGKGFAGNLPAFQYSGKAYDSVGSVEIAFPRDTIVSFGKLQMITQDTLVGVAASKNTAGCAYVFLVGAFNAAKDSITGVIAMLDNTGAQSGACTDQASFTAAR